jgi:hypothetical protein
MCIQFCPLHRVEFVTLLKYKSILPNFVPYTSFSPSTFILTDWFDRIAVITLQILLVASDEPKDFRVQPWFNLGYKLLTKRHNHPVESVRMYIYPVKGVLGWKF